MEVSNRILLLFLLCLSLAKYSGAACPAGKFECSDGKCIPFYAVCNYENDCKGGEDEQQSCIPPECETFQLACDQYVWNKTYCVPYHYRCDKTIDCSSGLDEEGCTYPKCQDGDVKCGDGIDDICVPGSKKCDGYLDCRSGRDEKGCPGVACQLHQVRCDDGKKCIESSQVCDHVQDCDDNSDEKLCLFTQCCNSTQFQCANGTCVPHEYRCDGHFDCIDESDEVDCEEIFHSGKFICPRGVPRFIPKKLVCDGNKDCEDGADEKETCSTASCPYLECDTNCVASFGGGVCSCSSGYVLSSDSKTCIDRNECTDWGYCEQYCSNSNGGYSCSCAEGYLFTNNTKCSSPPEMTPHVLFVDKQGISIIEKVGDDAKLMINSSGVGGVDYDFERNLLIWSNTITRKVYIQTLSENADISRYANTEIYISSTWSPVALAVDWIAEKIYVVDDIGQKIDLLQLDGKYNTIVLDTNLTKPTDIGLDSTIGYMFIADNCQILRANMDGTNITSIVYDATYKITGITVDIFSKRIFWCDSVLDYIETADYEGNYRFSVLRGQTLLRPNGLSSFENIMYWSDVRNKSIMSVDKFNGLETIKVVHYSKEIIALKWVKIIHRLKQQIVANPCGNNNGGCAQMCVLTAKKGPILSHTCACSIGWKLGKDLKNCEKIDEFLIYSQQQFVKGKMFNPVTESFNSSILPVVSKVSRFVGLDFDARDGYIYYSDVLRGIIYRRNIFNTTREIVLALEITGIEGLAIDWIAKNLYYTDVVRGSISVLSLKNFKLRRILVQNLRKVRAIAVHPNKGFLYFSQWDRPSSISRTYLDGTGLIVFELAIGWPNGLSIDYKNNRIYWCDGLLNHIRHTDLDGKDVKTIESSYIRHPFSLVFYEEFVYTTDWRLNSVVKLHQTKRVQEKIMYTEQVQNRVYGIKVFSVKLQIIEENQPCSKDNGSCEKFCFAMPSNISTNGLTVKCGCPCGEKLAEDGKTCVESVNDCLTFDTYEEQKIVLS